MYDNRPPAGSLPGPAGAGLGLAGRAGGAALQAIAFRAVGSPLGDGLLAARGGAIHAVGRLKRNDWNGRISVQLEIEDAAPAEA